MTVRYVCGDQLKNSEIMPIVLKTATILAMWLHLVTLVVIKIYPTIVGMELFSYSSVHLKYTMCMLKSQGEA